MGSWIKKTEGLSSGNKIVVWGDGYNLMGRFVFLSKCVFKIKFFELRKFDKSITKRNWVNGTKYRNISKLYFLQMPK